MPPRVRPAAIDGRQHDLEILEPYLKIAGPYICAIQMNDDFGAQNTLQISVTIR